MTKILITGGSGLLGKAISQLLLQYNYQPVWLSRENGSFNGIKKFKWDVSKEYINEEVFDGVESIIHLAGAGIADKRWTNSYKKEIIDSRVKSSELLFNYITQKNYPIKNLIGSSAIGYYGAIQSDALFSESDLPVNDFLSQACVKWEESYTPYINAGIRTAIIRTGVVLSPNGGAYKKMVIPFKMGFGAAIATGKQFFPWIHINDIAALFVHVLINKEIKGIYNGVSSELINNTHFSKKLAASVHKPFFLPNVPSFILKIIMGEGAKMITEGVKISNHKIKNTGFQFQFEKIDKALKSLQQ